MSSLQELRQQWNVPPNATLRAVMTTANAPMRANPFTTGPTKRPREIALTELKLPLASLPSASGRGRTFEIRVVPDRVVELAEQLLMLVNPDAKSMASIFATFQDFMRVNPRLGIDVAFLLFLFDAVAQGLKASSAITYGRTIISALSRKGTPLTSPIVGDTFKIFETILADEETEHARDISEDEAWAIIDGMEIGETRLCAWLMLVAGPRCKDQEHFKVSDFKLKLSYFYVLCRFLPMNVSEKTKVNMCSPLSMNI